MNDRLNDELVDYHALMQMHLRDNAHLLRGGGGGGGLGGGGGPPAEKKKEPWRDVTRLFTAVKPKRGAKGDGDGCSGDACCSICLDPFSGAANLAPSQRRPVCSLPCGHHFHRQCITDAVKHKAQCPLCRFDLERCAPATS